MPELPDVETFRRYAQATSLHQRIRTVQVLDETILEGVSPRSLQMRLRGHEFRRTRRHGKHLFLDITGRTEWMRMHFGMTAGLAYTHDQESTPHHARVVFHFANGHHLAFDDQRKLGRIGLIEDVAAWLREKNLGPDALTVDGSAFRRQFASRRGQVKTTLMNQTVLAGIGNIYADEILFAARLHPQTPIPQLCDDALTTLLASVHRVLQRAVEAQADPARLPKDFLLPHRETDGACPRCGHALQTLQVSGRTSYFCPRCQPAPSS